MRILRNAFFKGQRWVSKDFVEVDKNIYFDGMNISVDLRFVFSRFNKSFLIVLDVKFINKSEVVFKKKLFASNISPFHWKDTEDSDWLTHLISIQSKMYM